MAGGCPDLDLGSIARRCGPGSVGVSLGGRPFAASDVAGHELERAQFVLGEGPVLDRPNVEASNLEGIPPRDRWPGFGEVLAARSVNEVFRFRLFLHERWPFGALTLYRYERGPLEAGQACALGAAARELSLTLAAHVLSTTRHHDPECGIHWLDRLDQAIGVVMANLGIGADAAAARIRSHSYASDRPIDLVLADLVDRQLVLAPH
jgi:hypothetical protein